MNQGGYFGAYQSGFQTLPKNAYEMMTAPTQINGETIKKAASGIGSMVQKYADQKAGSEASQQGAAAQYSGLESTSQATGVPMNPVLADQYMNIGQMSPQQQAVFQNSLGQEAQRMQYLNTVNLQNRLLQNNSYAQDYTARAMGAPFIPSGRTTNTGVPAINMSGSLPLPQYNAGPRVNFPRISGQ